LPTIVVTTAVIALLGCSGGPQQTQAVTLAALVAEHDVYDGSTVIVEGVVQSYDQPRHVWIEDAEQHRVELFPYEMVADLVGQRIRVTGLFTFRDDRGRGIDIEGVEVLGEAPTAIRAAGSGPVVAQRGPSLVELGLVDLAACEPLLEDPQRVARCSIE
jgi:hypothetical protein